MKSMHCMTESGLLERERTESDGIETFRWKFLSILMARKREVEKALELLVEHQEDHKQRSKSDIIDDFDQAELEITTNTHYNLLERKSMELKKIRFLISRIVKEEEFDLCEECGQKIPEDRLLIIPEATLCVPCQRDREKMDSRRNLAERLSDISFNGKNGLQWKRAEGSDDYVEFIIETDMEGLSFHELEETEHENAFEEEDEIKTLRLPF